MMKNRFLSCVLLCFFSGSLSAFAGGPDYWEGNASSSNFSDSNWSGASANQPPASGDSLVFDAAGSNGTTLNNDLTSLSLTNITFNSDASAYTINGNDITMTGDIANNSSNNQTMGMSIGGIVINDGSGTGSVTLSGGVDSSVTTITENSSNSALIISTEPITVNGSGTTLIDTSGSMTVSGGISGTGNLILNNNSSTAGGITLSSSDINNTGTITNSGSGTGSSIISANIDSNVTNVIQNSSTSALVLSGNNSYTGTTTVSAGTLQLGSSTAIPDTSNVSIAGGATLDLNGNSVDIGSLAGAGTVTSSSSGNMTLTTGMDGSSTTFSGSIEDSTGTGSGTIGLTQDGSGTLNLGGNNDYSGATTVEAGTLQLGSLTAIPSTSDVTVAGGATLDLNGNSADIGSLSGAGTVTSSASSVSVTLAAGADNSSTTFSGTIQNGSGTVALDKEGSGTWTLSGNNTYSGGTTLGAGTLNLDSSNPIGSGLITFNGGTLQYSASNTTDYSSQFSTAASQEYNIDTNGEDVTFNSALISSGGSLTKAGSGILTLNADNTYSGGTTINAGTLQVTNANALGTGAVVNNATLDIGTTNLSLGSGSYTQNSGSTLALDIVSTSVYGSITSAVAASVASGSTVNVSVSGGYIPNGTTFEIINTGGAGVGADPSTVTSTSSFVDFTSSDSGGNLVLTAENNADAFDSFANNSNALALGRVLGSMTNPSSDMATVLSTLESQSSPAITSALNSMGPVVDGGVIQNSSVAFNNLVSATLDRIQDEIDHSQSGVSSGDTGSLNSLWAKPYGSYMTQDTAQSGPNQIISPVSEKYNAWNAGAVVGYDRMITDNFTLGVSGGYGYGQVSSVDDNATTDMNSIQGTIYGGYENPDADFSFFVDGMASGAWNWYDGQRDITVGPIERVADSAYNGQQYGAYLEGGYKIYCTQQPLYLNLQITPLASFQWTHLDLDSYTETNAGALDLNVNAQGYNFLESGLGVSIDNPIEFNWGSLTPEVHVKWLHDFTNEEMVVTSSFTGGGALFTSYGDKPASDGADVGGKLYLDISNNLSLIADADTEFKNGFFELYGSGTVRYKF